MADPVGLIGGGGGVDPTRRPAKAAEPPTVQGAGAPNFREALIKNLEQVNKAQADADRAVEDLVTGRRGDVEGVILATQKADDAFRMLQAVRGKVIQAYDEIKQVRV